MWALSLLCAVLSLNRFLIETWAHLRLANLELVVHVGVKSVVCSSQPEQISNSNRKIVGHERNSSLHDWFTWTFCFSLKKEEEERDIHPFFFFFFFFCVPQLYLWGSPLWVRFLRM